MVEKIKDFEIIYDEAKKEKIEEIKKIILNNLSIEDILLTFKNDNNIKKNKKL